MASPDSSLAPSAITPEAVDEVDDDAVDRIVAAGPAGTLALAGISIGLLLLIWFAFYFFVFLGRGVVG